MDEFNTLISTSLNRYFNTLSHTGYVPLNNVNQIVMLILLDEFLTEFQGYITDEDYRIVQNIVTCLYGSSCLIEYDKYKLLSKPLTNYLYDTPFRVTEDIISRKSESHLPRLANL